eukprot:412775-Rhodomonas_salina.1
MHSKNAQSAKNAQSKYPGTGYMVLLLVLPGNLGSTRAVRVPGPVVPRRYPGTLVPGYNQSDLIAQGYPRPGYPGPGTR